MLSECEAASEQMSHRWKHGLPLMLLPCWPMRQAEGGFTRQNDASTYRTSTLMAYICTTNNIYSPEG